MQQRKLLRLLLLPSFASGGLTVAVAIGILGYSGWLFTNHNQFFFNQLSGPYGLKTLFWQNTAAIGTWKQVFFASPIMYYIVLGGVAIAIGLTVFTILQAIGTALRGSSDLLHETLARRHHTLFMRLGLRVGALAGWCVYLFYFVNVLLPLIFSMNSNGITRLHDADYGGVAWVIGSLAVFMFSLHLHVIFLRLLALRPRLFGGDTAIVEAEAVH